MFLLTGCSFANKDDVFLCIYAKTNSEVLYYSCQLFKLRGIGCERRELIKTTKNLTVSRQHIVRTKFLRGGLTTNCVGLTYVHVAQTNTVIKNCKTKYQQQKNFKKITYHRDHMQKGGGKRKERVWQVRCTQHGQESECGLGCEKYKICNNIRPNFQNLDWIVA